MATNVYIDGFNLYNGSLIGTPYRWLDLGGLCATLLPTHTIHRIRYFTVRVRAFQHDPDAPKRQAVYLRAIETTPNLTIHKDGWFAKSTPLLPRSPLNYPNPGAGPELVRVGRMEEKRTDVDIATHLLVDAFDNDSDECVVISNDSDLTLPIQTVRDKFGKTVGVINPHRPKRMSGSLIRASSWYFRTINSSVLSSNLFPDPVIDPSGKPIRKPAEW